MAPFHPTSHHVGFQSRWMNQGLLISMLDNVPANPALRIYGCNMQQYLDLKPCCRLRPLKTSALIILCPVKIAIFGVPCSIQSWQSWKIPDLNGGFHGKFIYTWGDCHSHRLLKEFSKPCLITGGYPLFSGPPILISRSVRRLATGTEGEPWSGEGGKNFLYYGHATARWYPTHPTYDNAVNIGKPFTW